MPAHRFLPLATPTGRARRRRVEFDGTRIGAAAQHVTSPDESERTVIKVVDTEIVNHRSARSRGHVGIQAHVFAEKHRNITLCLISVIASHHSWKIRNAVPLLPTLESHNLETRSGKLF